MGYIFIPYRNFIRGDRTHAQLPIACVLVIEGLKSMGLTKTPKVCTIKISPAEILTIMDYHC